MLLDIRFIGNKFQGPRNFCTCMTDHFAIISLLKLGIFAGYDFGRCPVLKRYPFCSGAVGTFQLYPWKFRRGWSFSSNYTHDTYSTMCSGFRYLKHKQHNRQSGGSRSGSPHSIWKNDPLGWFQSLACATAPGSGLCPVSLADWWKFDLRQCLGWDGSNAFDGWWELQKRRE